MKAYRGATAKIFRQLTDLKISGKKLESMSGQCCRVVEATHKLVVAAQRDLAHVQCILARAKQGYKESLEELQRSEATVKSLHDEMSVLTAFVETLDTSLHMRLIGIAEELRSQTMEIVKENH